MEHKCEQLIKQPTHKAGGILDVLITRTDYAAKATNVSDMGVLSDHFLITANFPFEPSAPSYSEITSRYWPNFDVEHFKRLINESKLVSEDFLLSQDVEAKISEYNTCLTGLLDSTAPVKTKVCRNRSKDTRQWFDAECRAMKIDMRKKERKFRQTKTDEDRQVWMNSQKDYRKIVHRKKCDYWNEKLESNKNNPKLLWRNINRICGRDANSSVDTNLNAINMADHFTQKIETIRSLSAPSSSSSNMLSSYNMEGNISLHHFNTVSKDEVKKLILSQPNKQSELDPIPTWLLKKCLNELIPAITSIMNLSINNSIFPQNFKHSLVKPIIKKPNLDPNCPDNYRPVTNLSFLSKLLERIINNQITNHLNLTNTLAKHQSAYRRFHSTESVLMRTTSDLIANIANGELVLVSFLDMSAAFDTVDHDILLSKLEHEFGFRDDVLKWLSSYLSGRKYQIKFNKTTSEERSTIYGVPQGSVLGPVLFNLYTNQLESVIQHLGFKTYCYADDRLLFKSCSAQTVDVLKQDMISCIMNISSWMSDNMLKINPTKTEFLWVASQRRQHLINFDPICIQNVDIVPSKQVKFLGVYLDNALTMEKHISSVVSQSFFTLRQLKSVRRCLSMEGAKTVINSFVVSRLDYCNGILVNLPQYQFQRIQSVFNAAARYIYQMSRYAHISSTLQSLHWLRSRERVEFKLCLMVFKALNGLAPEYISELCIKQTTGRERITLRSHNEIPSRLEVMNISSKPAYVNRAFEVAGPSFWNMLPRMIREEHSLTQFKNHLKTHLFKKSHNLD